MYGCITVCCVCPDLHRVGAGELLVYRISIVQTLYGNSVISISQKVLHHNNVDSTRTWCAGGSCV